jgi:predicted Fe-S protein YdhL (DUF1289 family)
MYKRIFTSLTIAFAMAGAAFTGAATARQVQDSGAWAVPASTQTGVVSKPLAGKSQQAIIREKLGEIGAWAVPSNSTQTEIVPKSQQAIIREKLGEIGAWAVPSNSTQTEIVPKSQQAIIREKLGEIGAWAVPSNSTQTEIVPKSLPTSPTTVVASSSDRFDWNDAGIGAAFVFGAVLLGAASLVTIRRHQHHGPVAH